MGNVFWSKSSEQICGTFSLVAIFMILSWLLTFSIQRSRWPQVKWEIMNFNDGILYGNDWALWVVRWKLIFTKKIRQVFRLKWNRIIFNTHYKNARIYKSNEGKKIRLRYLWLSVFCQVQMCFQFVLEISPALAFWICLSPDLYASPPPLQRFSGVLSNLRWDEMFTYWV